MEGVNTTEWLKFLLKNHRMEHWPTVTIGSASKSEEKCLGTEKAGFQKWSFFCSLPSSTQNDRQLWSTITNLSFQLYNHLPTIFHGISKPAESSNPSRLYWVTSGPSHTGWAQNTSLGHQPGGTLVSCLNHLNWLLLIWRNNSSILRSFQISFC